MELNRHEIFHRIYIASLLLLAASLPLSMYMMSLSQLIMLGAWFLGGDIVKKFKTAFTNKAVLILVSVYFLHLLGLLWTRDFDYALKDIRIKLPLLALPVIFASSKPLSQKLVDWIFKVFIAAVFVSTAISFFIFLGFGKKEIYDIRQISIFISHIRLALLVCMAVYCCIYFATRNENKKFAWPIMLLAAWFVGFLFILESVTGIGILLVCLLAYLVKFIFKEKRLFHRAAFLLILFLITGFVGKEINTAWKNVTEINKPDTASLQKFTANGNAYEHHPERNEMENGNPVYINICEKELVQEWNKRSRINYFARDNKNNELRFGLIRFLASKNLRKDSSGVAQLSAAEIAAVENGIPNVILLGKGNFKSRLYIVAWEINNYLKERNPSGHSLTMRFEFWKAAVFIIRHFPLTGVGTGDVPRAYKRAYALINSPLSKEWRLRAHNQFLTIAVALGIPVLIYFLFSLIGPFVILKKNKIFLCSVFLITALLSMLTEDTLETQAGVTFFAFFNSFLLFLFREE